MNDLTPVRPEDAFDVVAVDRWLRQHLDLPSETPIVEQFRSGASNLTYLLRYPTREVVLRRPPHGTRAASAHDMRREARIQQQLKPVYPYVPHVIATCIDHSVIGSDFYVMDRIVGTILRREMPSELSISPDLAQQLGSAVIDGLADLHQVDPAPLADLGKGPGYVRRQISGWSARYRAALTPDVPTGEAVMSWLDRVQPDDVASTVIHGDWRLDNMVFDLAGQPQLVGVLDWELSTVGDPLMDLGSALAYWVSADDEPGFASLRRQPSHIPGMPTRAEFLRRYAARVPFAVDDFTFYEVFGLFRLAVICQQIWARYCAGQTTNPAFATFGEGVNILIARAEERIR